MQLGDRIPSRQLLGHKQQLSRSIGSRDLRSNESRTSTCRFFEFCGFNAARNLSEVIRIAFGTVSVLRVFCLNYPKSIV